MYIAALLPTTISCGMLILLDQNKFKFSQTKDLHHLVTDNEHRFHSSNELAIWQPSDVLGNFLEVINDEITETEMENGVKVTIECKLNV